MQPHSIVSREAWIAARKAHLAREKELTQARERLNEERRALPWVRSTRTTCSTGPAAKCGWPICSGGRRPARGAALHVLRRTGTKAARAASFWADGFERMIPHLAARDTTLVAISRAPLEELAAFKARMGWTFDCCHPATAISIMTMPCRSRRDAVKSGENIYNFGTSGFAIEDAPGISGSTATRPGKSPYLFLLRARPRHDDAAYHYSTSRHSVVTRKACRIRWIGCGYVTSTHRRRFRHPAVIHERHSSLRAQAIQGLPAMLMTSRGNEPWPMSTDFIVAVPKKNIAAYRKMSTKAGKIWREYGALGLSRMGRRRRQGRQTHLVPAQRQTRSRARPWCSPGSPTSHAHNATRSTPRLMADPRLKSWEI